jgi:hypothetical protein
MQAADLLALSNFPSADRVFGPCQYGLGSQRPERGERKQFLLPFDPARRVAETEMARARSSFAISSAKAVRISFRVSDEQSS